MKWKSSQLFEGKQMCISLVTVVPWDMQISFQHPLLTHIFKKNFDCLKVMEGKRMTQFICSLISKCNFYPVLLEKYDMYWPCSGVTDKHCSPEYCSKSKQWYNDILFGFVYFGQKTFFSLNKTSCFSCKDFVAPHINYQVLIKFWRAKQFKTLETITNHAKKADRNSIFQLKNFTLEQSKICMKDSCFYSCILRAFKKLALEIESPNFVELYPLK